ncbi:MAG: sulfite exporter TauE/SafE family protein [Bacteroidia bacterium]|nr:sulfite exporter TauE/SafE family protein [Bacteroidia bacterium]
MYLLSALSLGFLGSLHCVGMCGPISLALSSGSGKGKFWLGRLLYNLGRTTTYVLLGLLVGIFGQSLSLAGFQQSLSIILGISWLLILLLLPNWENRLLKLPFLRKFLLKIKGGLSSLIQKRSVPLMYNAGIMNGFLPCGLVYVALSGAMASNSLEESLAFMALFGLGTIPAMLALSFFSHVRQGLTQYIKPVLYTASLVFACLLILRGMNLDIPFLSPGLGAEVDPLCQ